MPGDGEGFRDLGMLVGVYRDDEDDVPGGGVEVRGILVPLPVVPCCGTGCDAMVWDVFILFFLQRCCPPSL